MFRIFFTNLSIFYLQDFISILVSSDDIQHPTRMTTTFFFKFLGVVVQQSTSNSLQSDNLGFGMGVHLSKTSVESHSLIIITSRLVLIVKEISLERKESWLSLKLDLKYSTELVG